MREFEYGMWWKRNQTVFRYTFECTTNSKLFLVKLYERRKKRDLLYTVISGEKLPVKQLISGKFLIFFREHRSQQ